MVGNTIIIIKDISRGVHIVPLKLVNKYKRLKTIKT